MVATFQPSHFRRSRRVHVSIPPTSKLRSFRSPRRFNVLAHEDVHRSSYQRSTSLCKVRFASIIDVGRPVVDIPQTNLWYSDVEYTAFVADAQAIVERYRLGCRSDDVLGLERWLCPFEAELRRLKCYNHVVDTLKGHQDGRIISNMKDSIR